MELSPAGELVSLLGVDYTRFNTPECGDLYLTCFGLPFLEQLSPENWHEPQWFTGRRVRLEGTSTIYRVPTRPVRGVSLDLVARFSRVGQEVPLDPRSLHQNPDADFNSPFEEFALVMQLRAAHSAGIRPRIFTKKPLAIYVPPARLQPWQTGRFESKMTVKWAQHPEVPLDMFRQYILLYGWIKGVNAVQAAQAFGIGGASAQNFLAETTRRVIGDLNERGFRVLDMKPEHVVLRIFHDGSLVRVRNGKLAYALVDYELLQRVE
jgi:hypothetical protein